MKRLPLVLLSVVLATAVLAWPALAAPGAGPGAAGPGRIATSAYCLDGTEQDMLDLIDNYRVANGLSPLSPTQTLGAAAEHHSLDMAASDVFSHTLLDGTTWSDNMDDHGYTYNTARGENIAAGNGDAESTFEQWRTSPEHNANMLDPDFHAIGIGRAYNANSSFGWYWTTTFGGVVDEGARACAAPAPGAGDSTATTTSNLNLRSGPSLSDDVLKVIPSGDSVALAGSASNGFVYVTYQGANGWASADYLNIGGNATQGSSGGDGSAPTTTTAGSATTASDLNLRADPSTSDDILDVIPAGASVSLTGQSESGFLSVSYHGQDGWAYASYLDTGRAANGSAATVSTRLNLRAGPSLSDDVVDTMPAGAPVTLTGQHQNGFVSVTYDGDDGWVFAAYLN